MKFLFWVLCSFVVVAEIFYIIYYNINVLLFIALCVHELMFIVLRLYSFAGVWVAVVMQWSLSEST